MRLDDLIRLNAGEEVLLVSLLELLLLLLLLASFLLSENPNTTLFMFYMSQYEI